MPGASTGGWPFLSRCLLAVHQELWLVQALNKLKLCVWSVSCSHHMIGQSIAKNGMLTLQYPCLGLELHLSHYSESVGTIKYDSTYNILQCLHNTIIARVLVYFQ